jgi:cobalt-zinc-cadmium efflux system membrane fusion protein
MKNIVYLIALVILSSCGGKKPAEENQTVQNENLVTLNQAQIKNAGILSGKAERRSISSVLKVNGSVDVPPQNKVSISVPLGGYLKETKLLPGMHVSKGDVIAVMEDPQYIQLQQDYLTAKSQLVYLEAEYLRQKELNQSKASSDKVFQLASSDYSSQKVLVRSLSEKLKLIGVNPETLSENNLSRGINVYSPINGFVSKVNVNVGKYTKPEEVLFEIVNPEDIHLVLRVFEKDIDKLMIGQKVTVYTNNDPGKKYECEIILIGKDFLDDRSVEIHCHFRNYDKSLIPGMFMNAEIEVLSSDVYALPSGAIVSSGNRSYVFVVKNQNEFEMVSVGTGNSEAGYTEIISDDKFLRDNQFIVEGAYTLLMKLKNTEN